MTARKILFLTFLISSFAADATMKLGRKVERIISSLLVLIAVAALGVSTNAQADWVWSGPSKITQIQSFYSVTYFKLNTGGACGAGDA
jgi:hypothetical protein